MAQARFRLAWGSLGMGGAGAWTASESLRRVWEHFMTVPGMLMEGLGKLRGGGKHGRLKDGGG